MEDNLDQVDHDSEIEDFNTESEEEQASDHSDGEVEWARPDTWDAQVRKNPDIAKFAATWTVPARRDSIPSLYTNIIPDQQPTFNIEPNGAEPFGLMFLDALPLQAFWRDIVVRQTALRAEQELATPDRSDGCRRWDNDRMNTVSNWLRV